MASHEAARRAVKAGYTNASVMSDGIVGWVNAGQPVISLAAAQRAQRAGSAAGSPPSTSPAD